MKNHNDREHAILSASGSKRWLKCPPSVRLEEVVETSTSIYALEGTFMHELSELHLHLFLDNITKVEFNKRLNEMKDNKFYTKENEKAVKIYVDAVIEKINEARARSKDPLILIEERLDYSPWVKEGFGTGDVLIITDEIIEVIDLKGGKGVKVSAVNNSQMKLYALGAINGFGMLYDIEKVIMTIIQPRRDNISTDEIDAHNLLKWAEEVVKPKAELAWKGEGEFCPGEHCVFCKIKATCKKRAQENMKLAYYEFKDPPLLKDEEIVEVLNQTKELKKWTSDVESYALKRAVNDNKKWPGMKLVEGRRRRRYSSESEVAQKLLDAGYDEERIYSKSLLSLTKLEKKIGKKEFKKVIGDLIQRPPGKLKLVLESDKRPEVKKSAEIDFKN